jgi:hypothetical protein
MHMYNLRAERIKLFVDTLIQAREGGYKGDLKFFKLKFEVPTISAEFTKFKNPSSVPVDPPTHHLSSPNYPGITG